MRVKCLLTVLITIIAMTCPTVTAGADEAVNLPVIMYHSVVPESDGFYQVEEATFVSDLKYLADNGYTAVSCRDILAFKDGADLPEKPILITFDDGYYNNYLYAYPHLEAYGVKATINVVGKYSGAESAVYKGGRFGIMNFDVLREMTASGLIEIGNHSYGMHEKRPRFGIDMLSGEDEETYKRILYEDIRRMQELAERELSVRPVVYAAPFGTHNPYLTEALAANGISVNLCCTEGMNRITRRSKLNYVKRFARDPSEDSQTFFRTRDID